MIDLVTTCPLLHFRHARGVGMFLIPGLFLIPQQLPLSPVMPMRTFLPRRSIDGSEVL